LGVGEIVRTKWNEWGDYRSEEKIVSYLQVEVKVFALNEEWGWCFVEYEEATEVVAKAVGACRRAPSMVKNFQFLRTNVAIWREFDEVIRNMPPAQKKS
jgi:hypothetical protein